MKVLQVFDEVNLAALPAVAESIVARVTQNVLLFYGDMGVGKTTLIKEICRALQVEDAVSSPTYSLVNEYVSPRLGPVYHFDLYRLEDETEAYAFGLEDYLDSGHWCLMEWPEKIRNLLPPHFTKIELELLPSGKRKLTLSTTDHE